MMVGMQSLTPASPPALSPQALEALEELTPYQSQDALAAASSLRAAGFEAQETSWLLTQARLRTLAAQKFGPQAAGQLLLTEAGYEQASRASVAAHHAQRFLQAGLTSVADLGCGLGADSLALATAGLEVTAVELDPATASLAAHNLSPYPKAQVLVGNLENLDFSRLTSPSGQPVQALWLDPARRTVEGGSTTSRTFDPEAFSPPFSFLHKLAATGIPMGVKLGPGLPHEAIPQGVEAEWVSQGGSVVEVVLWFNALAREGVARSASVLGPEVANYRIEGQLTSALPASELQEPLEVAPLGPYLLEPDGAVVRSHLVADLGRQLGASLIDEQIAYLTAREPVSSPLAKTYQIEGQLPLNEKKLRRWVKEEGITALTIKKRGVDVLPEKLRASLLAGVKRKKGQPAKEATLILTRLGSGASSQRLALLAQPLP